MPIPETLTTVLPQKDKKDMAFLFRRKDIVKSALYVNKNRVAIYGAQEIPKISILVYLFLVIAGKILDIMLLSVVNRIL